MIETHHRGMQFCGIERCVARSATAQRNHIELALRAFLRLEYHCFVNGISWFETKTAIIRNAVRTYLANPYVFRVFSSSINCVTPNRTKQCRQKNIFSYNRRG